MKLGLRFNGVLFISSPPSPCTKPRIDGNYQGLAHLSGPARPSFIKTRFRIPSYE
ncbi:hypothetical protein PAAG_11853 [Paracoccidioides lutzii Pb01]|uniref:Uncharacterized protein n=1 Tax=Paracoccidioides lutzii (strain ATCC MYA-826 / Pb01) TaxID=502779 RepID=A0A0A2V5G2_PARBA|nr:hypothetical protein PAAG_11853 [Paracoccidioides lutzii Pb01]KGQ01390.1 hypothetical protein PAAG_11853 [Paracoccidioides lutzii Pb01]